MKKLLAIVAAVPFLALGCGDDGEETGGSNEPLVVDDIPDVPALPQGDIELVFPEQIIPAGTEKQVCMFLEPTTEDRYFKALKAYQGRFGHHFILFKTANETQEEPGSIRDCTESSEMATLTPVLSSVNFGLESFPDGMALKVDAGTQMVLQMHYLNTSDKPIRVVDTMHVTEVAKEDVEVLAGFFGVSDINFRIKSGEQHNIDFRCHFPQDMSLLMVGPHMHEYGTSIVTSIGPENSETEVLRIDEWHAEYRDDPPITEWEREEAFQVSQGDAIRVQCNFDNTTDHPLIFPEEMCAAYGYFFPAQEGSEEWTCAPGAE